MIAIGSRRWARVRGRWIPVVVSAIRDGDRALGVRAEAIVSTGNITARLPVHLLRRRCPMIPEDAVGGEL